MLLGEAEAERGALARALLRRLVAREPARNEPAAEDVLAERVQLCVQLAAYFTHEATRTPYRPNPLARTLTVTLTP